MYVCMYVLLYIQYTYVSIMHLMCAPLSHDPAARCGEVFQQPCLCGSLLALHRGVAHVHADIPLFFHTTYAHICLCATVIAVTWLWQTNKSSLIVVQLSWQDCSIVGDALREEYILRYEVRVVLDRLGNPACWASVLIACMQPDMGLAYLHHEEGRCIWPKCRQDC